MLRRKRTSPYLIYSLLIHVILLLAMWWAVPKQAPLLPFHDDIEVSITHVERPPLPIKPVTFVEPPTPSVAPKEEPPPKPKPKAGLWQMETQDVADTPKPETRKQGTLANARHIGDGLSPVVGKPANYATEGLVKVNSLNQPTVDLPSTPEGEYVSPQGETSPVVLESDGTLTTLNGSSPTVSTPKIHYGSERGDALRATGVGNSWGGGGSSGGGSVGGVFVYMMKDLARTLASATETQKIDVIFVLDETASMTDNIRGIRAYVDFLFEAFDREGRDTTFGLVTFTDSVRKHGHTDDLGTFKNWLFDIGVDGGGDIAEAGLDGLMTAVTEAKFRKGAQRFIVLASDGAFHDADYDGRSAYSLDQVIETLQNAQVRVDVIGIDYLPIRQIALATGGTWRAIPGRGYLEYVPPLTLTVKLFSKLGTLNLEEGQMDDKITVYINNPPRPKELTLTWKVLNPLGERCYGPFTEKKTIPADGSTEVELRPGLDRRIFEEIPGIYTIIYRLENEQGHQSILRRTLTF